MTRRPMVFVHGLIGSLQAPTLHSPFAPTPTLAPDLLGYGVERGADPASITLTAQADHVHQAARAAFGDQPVTVIGHSVGGAIGALLAHRHPEQVAALVSVEGNFTLGDAFWSASVARMSEEEAESLMAGFRADPAGWLARSGVPPTPQHLEAAADLLSRQPGSTVRAMGRAVVEATGHPSYLNAVEAVFNAIPVHLVAGERSITGWNLPDWAKDKAASLTVIPNTGHMMMVENPTAFTDALARCLTD